MTIKKRFIATINMIDGLAVQSYGYKKYLPIGSPVDLVENFNRWGVDEILIQDIGATKSNRSPNFKVIEMISNLKINTPLIYGGGIRNCSDAVRAVNAGADRIVCGNLFIEKIDEIKKISDTLGAQAIIISIPVKTVKKDLFFFDYLKKNFLNLKLMINNINNSNLFSEILLTDASNEGFDKKFNMDIFNFFKLCNKDIIYFGGLNSLKSIKMIISKKKTAAIAQGNFLTYKELSYQNFLEKISSNFFRKSYYDNI